MRFPKEDKPAQTLRFDGSHEPFSNGVALRNAGRTEHNPQSGGLQDLTEAFTVLGVPVDDQVGLPASKAIRSVGQLPGHFCHPLATG